ncbi:MAG: DUF924 family protein [Candidatus Porifericomitaceae bacterium WSBS_2022_MAG_OTU9]
MSVRQNRPDKFPEREILHFWFRQTPATKWFAKDHALDREIRERFGVVTAKAQAGGYDCDTMGDSGKLALIIVLDQFSRNIYRGLPQAFAGDAKSLELTKELLQKGAAENFADNEKVFLYLPLEHSENLQDQELSVSLYEALGKDVYMHYVRLHRDIIMRFGRFPHRNVVLGRVSTAEELEFLAQPDSSF